MPPFTFRIPALVLIIAFVVGLVGLAGWGYNLEQRKADRVELAEVKKDIREDMGEIKSTLRDIAKKIDLHMERRP